MSQVYEHILKHSLLIERTKHSVRGLVYQLGYHDVFCCFSYREDGDCHGDFICLWCRMMSEGQLLLSLPYCRVKLRNTRDSKMVPAILSQSVPLDKHQIFMIGWHTPELGSSIFLFIVVSLFCGAN
ncbi:hypothetical protein SAY86_019106 [Trapa natans]|uniref:Uncharacterized protein n=1 Tax=Trapa natans TaxID=22666 RepID=A0AAN7LBH5_TRANT|nr:hypothetical protein SAY86_019106 [Trapa natans]